MEQRKLFKVYQIVSVLRITFCEDTSSSDDNTVCLLNKNFECI